MRKLTLTLGERVVLRPPIANLQGASLEEALKALNVLEEIGFTEKEEKILDEVGALRVPCSKCGTEVVIPRMGNVALKKLPESPKEVFLEEVDYEWLKEFLPTYKGWPVRSPLRGMAEAVKEAEKVKPGEEK